MKRARREYRSFAEGGILWLAGGANRFYHSGLSLLVIDTVPNSSLLLPSLVTAKGLRYSVPQHEELHISRTLYLLSGPTLTTSVTRIALPDQIANTVYVPGVSDTSSPQPACPNQCSFSHHVPVFLYENVYIAVSARCTFSSNCTSKLSYRTSPSFRRITLSHPQQGGQTSAKPHPSIHPSIQRSPSHTTPPSASPAKVRWINLFDF